MADATATEADGQEVLEDEPKNVLFAMIRQLKIGMDLHRITFPTFVLEPRSMLERITDFMSHQDLLFRISAEKTPFDRFVSVVRYFLSGWHIKPRGVKKPYNPVMGEYFRCKWDFGDGTQAFYLAEQVSHHPPVSAYFYCNPARKVYVQGHLAPRSKFLGNSAASIMGGRSRLVFTDLPGEEYIITMPNIYAVGLFLGTMTMELADSCTITCQKSDLVAEIDFKFKPMIGGTHNVLVGRIKRKGEVVSNITGKWSDVMYYTDPNKKGSKEILYAIADAGKVVPRVIPTEEKQGEFESRRLWTKVTAALVKRDQNAATDAKSDIENYQRKLRALREKNNVEWTPRFFKLTHDGLDWVSTVDISKLSEKELEAYVFSEVDTIVASIGNMSLDESVPASASASRDVADDLAEEDDQPGGEEED